MSLFWRATTHTFSGTGNREIPKYWPPSQFEQDPSNIPDDKSYNTHYDPSTAANKEGVYHMYEDANSKERSAAEPVPIPRFVTKRYIPTHTIGKEGSQGPGMTLLVLPGMGVPKEMFEPMLEKLLSLLKESVVQVDEIWSLDMPFSGETALVNPVGYMYAYLPLLASQELPDELVPRHPSSNGEEPVRKNIHVISHSLGAQCAMLAAAHSPGIFSSLSVMDPAMIPAGKPLKMLSTLPNDVYLVDIKERYPDQDSLIADLMSSKRTRGWDELSVRTFAERAFVSDSNCGIRLAGNPRLQWALYYDKETPTQCYDRLTDIRVPFNAIMPTRPFAVPPEQFKADIARMPQRTKVTWISRVTHQLPYERPDECMKIVSSWLQDMSREKNHREQARL
ncbi:Alpha/Beta hydrolase protein [Penicillium angulare]|uniref:Alpha/Beta hydrolase protein n=1 Tax=Penicillium angulare TaxID=116970 RepID=A0A9W9EKR7_9EURO|nr:Alpha/Beta hydrolase protein [Penicillium angulare]